MGSVDHPLRARVVFVALVLTCSVLFSLVEPAVETEGAPNPIPIVTLSLYPSSQRATVDDAKGDIVQFDGNCTVDQLDLMTCTVTLTGTVSEGWSLSLSPQTMEFTGSRTQRFQVTVVVPAGVETGVSANVIVRAEAKVPVLAPIVAAASAVIDVKNTSPDHQWDVRITSPEAGSEFTTDVLTVAGTASYDLGTVDSVEVKVCTGPWTVATGTDQWTIEYDCSYLDDGEHAIYARARSGEDVSPTQEVVVTQDRSSTTVTPEGGSDPPGAGEGGDQGWAVDMYLPLGGLAVLAAVVGLLLLRRRVRAGDPMDVRSF